jgi:hypothetical protein
MFSYKASKFPSLARKHSRLQKVCLVQTLQLIFLKHQKIPEK